MVELVAKSPAEGRLPIVVGGVSLEERSPTAITWIAALRGGSAPMPKPGQTLGDEDQRWVWFGRGQALVVGQPPEPSGGMAMTDQSDGWCVLRLEGDGSRDVLARLTPLDVRAHAFGVGQTARTLLGHMTCSLTRTDENTFEIMVFRSMAPTAVHELERAMAAVNARS